MPMANDLPQIILRMGVAGFVQQVIICFLLLPVNVLAC